MAKIIKKKSDLVRKYRLITFLHFFGTILFPLCGVIYIEVLLRTFSFEWANPFGIACLVGLFLAQFTRDQMGIINAGVKGEAKAMKIISSKLPDTFYCISNAIIEYNDRYNELDLIVVGPSGICIVEVKNVSGKIYGDYSDATFRQMKSNETKEMRNPIRQVSTHVDILSRYLKAHGIRCWVRGAVFFANPKCEPVISNIPSNQIQVFAASANGEEAIVAYLNTERVVLSPEEIEKIVNCI